MEKLKKLKFLGQTIDLNIIPLSIGAMINYLTVWVKHIFQMTKSIKYSSFRAHINTSQQRQRQHLHVGEGG